MRVRAEAMRDRNDTDVATVTKHTVRLQPLKVGDPVFLEPYMQPSSAMGLNHSGDLG